MSKSDRLLFILCGPSGAGKTTLAHHLLRRYPDQLTFSVSYTTRAPRSGEVDGVDYHFRRVDEFERMRQAGAFAEWASVHGNFYGTAVATIEEAWAAGKNVIFDIDYQGALQLRERFGTRAVVVLVCPPSMELLAERLRGRGTDDEAVVERRLRAAREEIEALERFADFRLENAELSTSIARIEEIYASLV